MLAHMTLTDEQVHFLAQVSPYVANASNAEGAASHGWRERESGLVLEVSPLFVEKSITLTLAFCEWERLEECAEPERPKRGARVSAMISALTTCPFDSHYATVLER